MLSARGSSRHRFNPGRREREIANVVPGVAFFAGFAAHERRAILGVFSRTGFFALCQERFRSPLFLSLVVRDKHPPNKHLPRTWIKHLYPLGVGHPCSRCRALCLRVSYNFFRVRAPCSGPPSVSCLTRFRAPSLQSRDCSLVRLSMAMLAVCPVFRC